MKTNTHFFYLSRSLLLRMKIKTQFLFNNFFENRAVYDTV